MISSACHTLLKCCSQSADNTLLENLVLFIFTCLSPFRFFISSWITFEILDISRYLLCPNYIVCWLNWSAFSSSDQPFCSGGAGSHSEQWIGLWLSFPAWVREDQAPGLECCSFEDPNQANLHHIKSLGQTMPLTWLCRWPKPLAGTTSWVL